MYIRNFKLTLIAGLSLAAVLVALPGAAQPQALETRAAKPQAMFGLFLDPHVEPELHFELDRGLEHAGRIDEVLRRLKEDGG